MDREHCGNVTLSDLVGEEGVKEGDITDGWHDPVHAVQEGEDEAEVTEGHRPASQAQYRHVGPQPLSCLRCPGLHLRLHLVTTAKYYLVAWNSYVGLFKNCIFLCANLRVIFALQWDFANNLPVE